MECLLKACLLEICFFSRLPYEMGNMQKLKAIVLDGNPMKSIRRDIIMVGEYSLIIMVILKF